MPQLLSGDAKQLVGCALCSWTTSKPALPIMQGEANCRFYLARKLIRGSLAGSHSLCGAVGKVSELCTLCASRLYFYSRACSCRKIGPSAHRKASPKMESCARFYCCYFISWFLVFSFAEHLTRCSTRTASLRVNLGVRRFTRACRCFLTNFLFSNLNLPQCPTKN